MRTAEQWTALYQDGGSALNDPPRHITDIVRDVQREAFDAGARAMRDELKKRLAAKHDMRAFGGAFISLDASALEGRP